jgi:hypothetical protein
MSTSQPAPSQSQGRRWQFSLFTLLVAMTCVGLACVALVSPSELWRGITFILAVGSLPVAGLCIVYRQGRTRAFAVGFVIFGTAYFLVSLGDTPDVPDAHSTLPTTRWGIALYSIMHGDNVQTTTTVGPLMPAPWQPAPVPVATLAPQPAQTIERVVMTTPTDSIPDSAPSYPTPSYAPAPPVYLPPPVAYVTTQTIAPVIRLSSFLSVVHYLLILALGVLGGIIAQFLHATRRDAPAV